VRVGGKARGGFYRVEEEREGAAEAVEASSGGGAPLMHGGGGGSRFGMGRRWGSAWECAAHCVPRLVGRGKGARGREDAAVWPAMGEEGGSGR
jgi:hypothetical protein